FYSRKVRREGLSSLKTYLTIRQILYVASRLRALLFPSMIQKRLWMQREEPDGALQPENSKALIK
ncbi:MAG: hypothetical protein MJA27_31315, partial [Pseudanabaenales cyanobacterium]|nr:hypothetical protein [Pseudanabaenales cyanobacterium]